MHGILRETLNLYWHNLLVSARKKHWTTQWL